MNNYELAKDVLHQVIIPALDAIGCNSLAAQELVLGTGIHESKLIYRRQLQGGPAVGLFQIEPRTFNHLWYSFVPRLRKSTRDALLVMAGGERELSPDALVHNDQLAAAMCRVFYLAVKAPLPKPGQLDSQARYWKRYYNTVLGKGTVKQYIRDWHSYVDPFTFSLQL